MDSEETIKAAARDWLLRLSLESPTEHERARWAAWCAEDPRHAAAYRRVESIWQEAATLEELKPLAWLPPARDPWWRRVRASVVFRPVRWAASASLAATITGIGLWFLLTPAHYATGIAEVRDIHLPDGSEVTLGARSSLEVAFRRHERRVALTSGVAFFSVAKNASRPFIVGVGDKEVRVVGTKFEIRREPGDIRVSVVEGRVDVMQVTDRSGGTNTNGGDVAPTLLTSIDTPEERILKAGQQVTTTLVGAIPDPQVMPRGEPAAWRHGRLVYVDAPLKDIIADANRYSRVPIEIADEGIANIQVSVSYPSNRIEEMVSALSQSLSLDIERDKSGGFVLKGKKPSD